SSYKPTSSTVCKTAARVLVIGGATLVGATVTGNMPQYSPPNLPEQQTAPTTNINTNK
ncbi:unnamed protein product, partial [Adineta steineri]